MDKRNSWTIALLLAAVVPFATGCNECKEAKKFRGYAETVMDRLDEISTNGAAHPNRALTRADCDLLLPNVRALKTLNDDNKTPAQLLEEKYCDKDSRHRDEADPFCHSSLALANAAHQLAGDPHNVQDPAGTIEKMCDALGDGGNVGTWGRPEAISATHIVYNNFNESVRIFREQESGNETVILDKACGAGESARHAQERADLRRSDNTPPPSASDRASYPPQPLPGSASSPEQGSSTIAMPRV